MSIQSWRRLGVRWGSKPSQNRRGGGGGWVFSNFAENKICMRFKRCYWNGRKIDFSSKIFLNLFGNILFFYDFFYLLLRIIWNVCITEISLRLLLRRRGGGWGGKKRQQSLDRFMEPLSSLYYVYIYILVPTLSYSIYKWWPCECHHDVFHHGTTTSTCIWFYCSEFTNY